ncbi:MAG TPA: energy-coupling factor ABC transporter permease [Spirochaetota bacterium]|nr:energy-coupling factor ABC transporter permease [Spirochaetota bacterium]HPI88001.1 energy-coupling factor ABC transporter permease [Spirochaetota bacterium]HPR46711.1 energy-coupling factor ABC transporter permease [Spirochaetota bacterium]
MHMADALISPAVGGTMIAATAGLIGYSSKKLNEEMDDSRIPLMGVMGAFIFAGQMINFTIPATGSSGHIGGGILLAILLGPYAAFLTIASVLVVQALFFADGGLLALGCNIFNMGFFPCFIVYPLVFKKIMGSSFTKGRLFAATTLSAILGLQLGAFCVVLQTLASGVSELPFATFVLLMQPIHLAIGLVEGLASAAVVLFIYNMQPEIIDGSKVSAGAPSFKKVLVSLVVLAVITGGLFSWFASAFPDGLEWSMFKTAGVEELEKPKSPIYGILESIQEKTAFLPDYDFKAEPEAGPAAAEEPAAAAAEEEASWPAVSPGTSVSGILGGAFTLIIALLFGFAVRKRKVVDS